MRWHLTGLAATLTIATAYADEPKIVALSGQCTKVVVADQQLKPELCFSKVANLILPNGREGFIFMIRGDAPISIGFFGNGTQETHQDVDHASLPIDTVDEALPKGQGTSIPATGSCQFANPTTGVPVPLTCSATTEKGRFVGEFMSDGRAPKYSDRD
jgi:hypothetical protein